MPATLNAANEVAVDTFLQDGMSFLEIPKVIEQTMNACTAKPLTTLEDALEADRVAREKALEFVHTLAK